MESIIEKYYYIIKVDCGKTRKTYYKIGEAVNKTRPENLVEKYNKYSSNNASIVSFEKLPYKGEKRLNDKLIHKSVDSSILVKANEYEIQVELGEVDGKDEFFELVDKSIDIIMYINSVVASIKPSHYTAKVTKNTTLVYDADTYHKVDSELLDKITNKFTDIDNLLYRSFDKTILLIGQFEFDFIASFAMSHLVIIWHDSADNKHTYSYSKLNNNIIYVDTLQEVFDLTKEINLIIANPPYGKIGDNITNAIIDNVDFDEYINLLPLKDYSKDTGKYIDFSTVCTFPPHSFGDADILTHAVSIKKSVNNRINSELNLCAESFTVDKPMIKFMKANMNLSHPAIDNIHGWKEDNSVLKTFVFHELACKSQHTSGFGYIKSNSIANLYNFQNIEIKEKQAGRQGCLRGAFLAIVFDSELERKNFVEFYKNNLNFINRMVANQFISIRNYAACFPKVDWTKDNWTIESILKYVADYSDEEIKAVIDTMNKDYNIGKDSDIERLFGEYLNDSN